MPKLLNLIEKWCGIAPWELITLIALALQAGTRRGRTRRALASRDRGACAESLRARSGGAGSAGGMTLRDAVNGNMREVGWHTGQ